MVKGILTAIAIAFGLVSIPALPPVTAIHAANEEREWAEYHADAFAEYADEFTALFNSYETKWSKNNRLMIRQGDTGSFKFARKH